MKILFRFLKYVDRVKSYGRVKIWVRVKPGIFQKAISQKLFNLETSYCAQIVASWEGFSNMHLLDPEIIVVSWSEVVKVFDLDLGQDDLRIKLF